MVNGNVTHADVSQAIRDALSPAQTNDVIVISFAGHGSPDDHMVLFDTDAANVSGTALWMAALAEAFKTTKARVVLCILDCCFRGC